MGNNIYNEYMRYINDFDFNGENYHDRILKNSGDVKIRSSMQSFDMSPHYISPGNIFLYLEV